MAGQKPWRAPRQRPDHDRAVQACLCYPAPIGRDIERRDLALVAFKAGLGAALPVPEDHREIITARHQKGLADEFDADHRRAVPL
jgi:hypothetical protein